MGRAAPEYDVSVVDDERPPVTPSARWASCASAAPGASRCSRSTSTPPSSTAAAFTTEGWFRTGDRVRLEEDGSLCFVERDKDVLKVGGENVGAPEIERVLLEVSPACARPPSSGRPDRDARRGAGRVRDRATRRLGVGRRRRPRAATSCSPTSKRPREIRVVDELPRSTLDKVAKARSASTPRGGRRALTVRWPVSACVELAGIGPGSVQRDAAGRHGRRASSAWTGPGAERRLHAQPGHRARPPLDRRRPEVGRRRRGRARPAWRAPTCWSRATGPASPSGSGSGPTSCLARQPARWSTAG